MLRLMLAWLCMQTALGHVHSRALKHILQPHHFSSTLVAINGVRRLVVHAPYKDHVGDPAKSLDSVDAPASQKSKSSGRAPSSDMVTLD